MRQYGGALWPVGRTVPGQDAGEDRGDDSLAAGPSQTDKNAANVSAPVPTQTPDGTRFMLATQVDWQPGDWMSVVTMNFPSHQTKIVQISAIALVSNPELRARYPNICDTYIVQQQP